jgi:hypothetical protein
MITVRTAGCPVQGRAYFDQDYWASSRFDFQVAPPAGTPDHWDFTLDRQGEITPEHYIALRSGQSLLPYGRAAETTIRATLWRYDTLEERVTFHDLDLRPLADDWMTRHGVAERFLDLKSARTATTPSGITITLPAQQLDSMPCLNGNGNALFIRIQTTPDDRNAVLPESPLYRKYRKPARIFLGCEKPDGMVFYEADNTYKTIAVDIPELRTATHLDSLTLIVRQRVNLQCVPVAVTLPVSREGLNRPRPEHLIGR